MSNGPIKVFETEQSILKITRCIHNSTLHQLGFFIPIYYLEGLWHEESFLVEVSQT